MAYKMKAEVKKLWTEALRSGKYKQATGALQKDGGMCCLGVLGDVLRRNNLAPVRWEISAGYWYMVCDGARGDCVPPRTIYPYIFEETVPNVAEPIRVWEAPREPVSCPARTLYGKNDNGTPFSEIADIIDRDF